MAAEQSLAEVEVREKALAVRLENLRQVAPDSVKVFEELLDRKMELSSRSSRAYFIWGVVATVVVGLVGLLLAPYVAAAL